MVYNNRFVLCVLVDGKPVKELANGEVHIPFNKEYVLRFRNKNDRRATVKFFIDGENVSGNGYIIPANDSIDIKRHSVRDAAFKLVELDSPEAVDAGKNGPNHDKIKGVIEAQFTLEKKSVPIFRKSFLPRPVKSTPYPTPPYPPFDPTYGPLSGGGASIMRGRDLNYHSIDNSVEGSQTVSHCSMGGISPPTVQDGCTVEGNSTGQTFTSEWFDPEIDMTSLKIFLRGYHQEVEVIKQSVSQDTSTTTDNLTDLEKENERLKRELQLEEENRQLRERLKNLRCE